MGKVLRNHNIKCLFKIMWFSPTSKSLDSCYFPKKFGTQLEKELIYMCIEKKSIGFII